MLVSSVRGHFLPYPAFLLLGSAAYTPLSATRDYGSTTVLDAGSRKRRLLFSAFSGDLSASRASLRWRVS